jgi:protein involved in polysaccharide export with SLBB domain
VTFLCFAVLAGLAGPAAGQAPSAVATVRSAEVVLQPGDLVQITVWPNAELGGSFAIEETGMVHLPYLGSVRAAGVPIGQLRDRLRAGYEQAVQNPVVGVTPVFQVSLLGEVRLPGIYQIRPTDSFFDVVGQAGGFTVAADLENVRLFRRDGSVVEMDALRGIEEGDLAIRNFGLNSGDQIQIPTLSPGYNWRAILTAAQTILTMALLIDRLQDNR